ncbi:MAG: hypothetical protein AAGI48_08415 [Verrucomicrobiota bacterium]
MPRLLTYALIVLLTAATAYLGWRFHRIGAPGSAGISELTTPDRAAPPRTRKANDKRKPPVPHLVRQLTQPGKHLSEQIEAVRALPDDLDHAEFTALVDILHQTSPPKTDPGRWYTLQNEIMEVLRQPRFTREGYPGAMAGLVADRHADPVMRDYAAQHLALYLGDRADSLPEETLNNALDALLGVLSGSREAHQQVAGTTLMALCDLDTRRPGLLNTRRPVLEASIANFLAPESQASLANRIAAIQAAGRMTFTALRPEIRSLAEAETTNASLKLSSIAALGYFADPADKTFLTNLAEGSSKLRFAASTALKNFDN